MIIEKKIINQKKQRLSKLLAKEFGLNFANIQKIIRQKDVKIQGKRTSKDIDILEGWCVEVFLAQEKPRIVFENNDLLVAYKPHSIETVNDAKDDLKTLIEKFLGFEIYAVHRLDRNTEGLVIFAKNVKTKNSLDIAIKNRKIQKFYLAKVVGRPEKNQDNLTAYLKKDVEKSRVFISDVIQDGFEKIKTNYKVVEQNDDFSILEVELITGKTHQIRAHLAHIGYPILGDDKYGNRAINKKFNKKFQCLCAYKLVFYFEEDDYLSNMNGVAIELDKSEINFYKINL